LLTTLASLVYSRKPILNTPFFWILQDDCWLGLYGIWIVPYTETNIY
jgi:hypothetical protein